MSHADLVNTWFREKIACGAIARDTEAYNQAFKAIPDLIERLAAPAEQAPAPQPKPAVAPSAPDQPEKE